MLGMEEEMFDDIPITDCMLLADVEFPDQPRGLPAFTHALQDLLDLKHTTRSEQDRNHC